jgi:5-methylcytosine-specific restriction endonuclease McrA
MILQQEPLCYYCSMFGLVVASVSVDHKTPKSRGGSDGRANLTGACQNCNSAKGDMTSEEFIQLRMQRQLGRKNV